MAAPVGTHIAVAMARRSIPFIHCNPEQDSPFSVLPTVARVINARSNTDTHLFFFLFMSTAQHTFSGVVRHYNTHPHALLFSSWC